MRAGNPRFEPRRKAKRNALLMAGGGARPRMSRSPNRLAVWGVLAFALGLYAQSSGYTNFANPLYFFAAAAVLANVVVLWINREPL